MGQVFAHDSSVFYRLWCWLKLFPSYLNPRPIESSPLSDEELAMLDDLEKDANDHSLR